MLGTFEAGELKRAELGDFVQRHHDHEGFSVHAVRRGGYPVRPRGLV